LERNDMKATPNRMPQPGPRTARTRQVNRDQFVELKHYIAKHGEDLPEIRQWKWGASRSSTAAHSPDPTRRIPVGALSGSS
jgi:hypothetical protein